MLKTRTAYGYTKTALLSFAVSFFCTKVHSQKCPLFYDKGNIYTLTEANKGSICSKRTFDETSANGFHTKYSIINSANKELYALNFYFYPDQDSISVQYNNVQTGNFVPRSVSYIKGSSTRMFKDYGANDTSISAETRYCTLFTVPEPTRPFVILNQFQLPDEDNTYLFINPINPVKLQQHLDDVANYGRIQDSLNAEIAKEAEFQLVHKQAVADLFKSMKAYRDEQIEKFKDEADAEKYNTVYVEATPELESKLKDDLDPVFVNYFRDKFTFTDANTNMKFTFFINSSGEFEASKTDIHAEDSYKLQWFEDKYKEGIEGGMKSQTYKTISTTKYSPGLINDFNARYADSVKALNLRNDEYGEFVALKKEIMNDLDKYLQRDVNNPTKYNYRIKYRSTVEYAEWNYDITRKGLEKAGPKGNEAAASEDLRNIFLRKIVKKEGKYKVKIATVYINDKMLGQDMMLQ
ncbi:MAG TPA: hypothetical protein VKH37_06435 [Ferruginibacter sp.]|nr:hypothetical protein [Ferruginibacter sp.]